MKKVIGLSSVALLGVLAACGNNAEENNAPADDTGNNNAEGNEEAAADVDYPEGPIEIIVPYSAGGGGDTVARIIGDALAEELDAQVNVVNREGAGGEIGIAEMAAAEPDGHTLGVFGYPDNYVLEETGDTDFSFDSFEYLASFDDVPHALFAAPDSEFESIEDLVNYAEENPGEVTIGESGALGLLKILAFEDQAEIDVSPVNYDGGGELINGLLGGHIDIASSSITAAPEIVDAGGEPLGYAAPERLEMFDEYPTLEEQGYDMDLGVRRVVVAPADVPDEVRDALTDVMDQLGESEELEEQFTNAELPYNYLDYDELNDYLNNTNESLQPIIDNNQDDF
jgi:tripartite-type tricarboxylate transporter receptor subunit TctC